MRDHLIYQINQGLTHLECAGIPCVSIETPQKGRFPHTPHILAHRKRKESVVVLSHAIYSGIVLPHSKAATAAWMITGHEIMATST